MSPENSMTSIARSNGTPSIPVAGRPPIMAWTLRLLLCTTDPRTQEGETIRLLNRMVDDGHLTREERAVVVETVKSCLLEIRKGIDLVGELHPSQRSAQ